MSVPCLWRTSHSNQTRWLNDPREMVHLGTGSLSPPILALEASDLKRLAGHKWNILDAHHGTLQDGDNCALQAFPLVRRTSSAVKCGVGSLEKRCLYYKGLLRWEKANNPTGLSRRWLSFFPSQPGLSFLCDFGKGRRVNPDVLATTYSGSNWK